MDRRLMPLRPAAAAVALDAAPIAARENIIVYIKSTTGIMSRDDALLSLMDDNHNKQNAFQKRRSMDPKKRSLFRVFLTCCRLLLTVK